jgi:hypothetical protein
VTAIHQVTLTCDSSPGCGTTWTSAAGQTAAQARAAARQEGWTSRSRRRDGCPEHPATLPGRPVLGGALIRVYDCRGALLYVSTTQGSPSERLRVLRSKVRHDWWPLVDPTRTLIVRVPKDVDVALVRDAAIRREHPRFFRDENGDRPYRNYTKVIGPTPLDSLTKASYQ